MRYWLVQPVLVRKDDDLILVLVFGGRAGRFYSPCSDRWQFCGDVARGLYPPHMIIGDGPGFPLTGQAGVFCSGHIDAVVSANGFHRGLPLGSAKASPRGFCLFA